MLYDINMTFTLEKRLRCLQTEKCLACYSSFVNLKRLYSEGFQPTKV